MVYFSTIENDNIIYLKLKLMTKEEVVEMLVYFAEQYPDMFYKHMEDDDLGEGAFTEFVEEYINREKND